MKKICENPKIKLRTLIRKSHSKWNVDLTKTKAARVKQQALDEINGYPCEHVMSCIRKMCLDVKNYVNYVDCYQHVIYPMNGPNLWDRTQNDDVLPPVFKKPIGRPKLSRNKTGDESCNNGPLSKLSRDHNATPEAKKSARTTRILNPSKNAAKTTTKATIKLQPKRKSNT
ncbi:hypothetical protein Ahy_A03g012128 [Arachis hypogaea]|uniref:Uncharacterized protein n=1 Tax=Arachis hypogaea TaxID=3818 RepID=A0A445DSL9_ARAHY|nr:hypothetical protein Ahy_A03g012128 [Arachis hypogaea]